MCDFARTACSGSGAAARNIARQIEFAHGCAVERGNDKTKCRSPKVCSHAYVARVSLAAAGYYRTPDVKWDWTTATGRPFHYFACGAAVAEVEVDGFNGMHRVRRVDIVHDVGDSLNPGIDRGQIEGGFVQGMGWLTREELPWDQAGRLLTHSASTYQIPAFSDAPVEFNVTLLPKAAQPIRFTAAKRSVGRRDVRLLHARSDPRCRAHLAKKVEKWGWLPPQRVKRFSQQYGRGWSHRLRPVEFLTATSDV